MDEEEDNDDVYLKVSRIPWDPAKVPLDGTDYIFAMVLETPGKYYVVPRGDLAFVYIAGRGLLCFRHDFAALDEDQRDLLVHYLRRDLSS